MNGKELTELLDTVAEKVEKATAKSCIILANQYENGKAIARDIAEKYGINTEDLCD